MRRPSTAFAVFVVVASVLVQHAAGGLYLPGVLPISYVQSAPVAIKVNSLTSVSKIMPMPWYSMPWCSPSKDDRKKYRKSQNLGEIIAGDQIEISLFKAEMLVNATCRQLCDARQLTKEDQEVLTKRIEENYRGNLVLDGLPVAEEGSGKQSVLSSSVAVGFPLGLKKKLTQNGKTMVFNHLEFTIQYHEHGTTYITEEQETTETYRIVGFQVAPMSIDYTQTKCDAKFDANTAIAHPVYSDATEITWTYSINWAESDIKWASRWDVYMKSTSAEARIHWMSIMNSVLVVLLLTVIIGFILVRALRKDLARYNDPESLEEDREETGWKLLHGDVYRTPDNAGLLTVYVGTGMQLLCMIFVTLCFSLLGFVSPANRGSLLTALIFLFVLLGSYAGYTTARMAKFFKMKSWKIIFAVGLMFPGQMFLIYFCLNFVHWGAKASSATPFTAMLTLAALWSFVSLPLVLLGGAVGYRRSTLEVPCKVHTIPRTVPPVPWYLQYPFCALIPGILPFGAAFIESVFILGSVWQGRIYYMFGFLMLVFIILIVTCAETTIVMIYFQLIHLDYNWWWRSFFSSGSYGVWLFLYSVVYYATALTIRSWWSSVLYFGYMLMVSYFAFVLTGTIGFLAAWIFIKVIYGSIKID